MKDLGFFFCNFFTAYSYFFSFTTMVVLKHIANVDRCADLSDYNLIFFVNHSPDRGAAVLG